MVIIIKGGERSCGTPGKVREVEVIEFEGVYYPTRCSYCSLPIKDSAIVLPPTRQIFHDEDCVSFYIGLHARNINHIREEGEEIYA